MPRNDDSRAPTAPLRVLVVDDDSDTRRAARSMLEARGHLVRIASNGRAAIGGALTGSWDLVLMDLDMPVLDGFEAARCIRVAEASLERPRLRLVAFSSLPEQLVWEGQGAGHFDAFIPKTVRIDHFADAVVAAATPPARHSTRNPTMTRPDATPDARQAGSEPEPVAIVDRDIADLVPEFLENRRTDIDDLRRLATEGDFVTMRRLGHSMKGTGTAYGFVDVSELGDIIEVAMDAGDLDRALAAVDALERYLDTVRIEYIDLDD